MFHFSKSENAWPLFLKTISGLSLNLASLFSAVCADLYSPSSAVFSGCLAFYLPLKYFRLSFQRSWKHDESHFYIRVCQLSNLIHSLVAPLFNP